MLSPSPALPIVYNDAINPTYPYHILAVKSRDPGSRLPIFEWMLTALLLEIALWSLLSCEMSSKIMFYLTGEN